MPPISEQQQKRLLLALSLSVAAILQVKAEWFIYDRLLMLQQPWRFLTAHWVHVGWVHYGLNMLAFVCLPFIFPKISARLLAFLMCILPILISLIFYCFYPTISLYAGFSGVLHGLYVVAALISWTDHQERGFAVLILCGIAAKLIWEASIGGLSATMRLIGSPILIEAHQWGVAWGLVILVLGWCIKKLAV